MKLILHFLKPYRWLCVFTILAMLLDVAGGLLVPRLTADMINIGVESGNLDYMIRKGIAMLAVTVFSGAGALLGSWLCADLSAKIGEDMRNAVYEKSLTFSAHDFEQFGTGSMITRTLNDINIIQQSVVWCIQMVLPVPAVCIMGVGMAFAIDTVMGFLLIGVTTLIIVLALLVTRKASEIFGRLQRLLDRMNVVLRENLTGVRVIRAFNKEKDEERRMRKTFEDYACKSLVCGAGEYGVFRHQHCHRRHPVDRRKPDRRGIYGDRGYHGADGILHPHPVLYHHGTDGDHPSSKSKSVHWANPGTEKEGSDQQGIRKTKRQAARRMPDGKRQAFPMSPSAFRMRMRMP